MISFKKFFLIQESQLSSTLSPTDLYNFYFIATLSSMGRLNGDYANFIADDFLKKLKQRYLVIFKELLYHQIRKYISRRRTDSDLTMDVLESNKNNAHQLYEMMKKTFRSDMKRRNDVWNLIGEYTEALEGSGSLKSIIFYIDRLNNCIHNTQELIFSKFPNAQMLLSTFDTIHHAQSLNVYKNKVSKDIRELDND